jgi:hypothetical protein
MVEAMQQAEAIRELDFHAGNRRNEQAGFSVRTVFLDSGRRCLLLSGDANRLGAVFSRQQGLPFLSPARGPHFHSACLSPPGTGGPTRWPPLAVIYFATQQAHWPPLYALHCEVFDAVKNVLAAAGIRLFIKSPFHRITLREAIIFVLIAVVIVPFGTAFWGAAFTVSNHFGTHYWIEWRNLSISNGVTAIVLVPAILIGVHRLSTKGSKPHPAHSGSMFPCRGPSRGRIRRLRSVACGTGHFARAPLCTRSPAHLGGPPLWAWRHERLHAGHHDPGDLGNDARTRPFLTQTPRKTRWPCSCSS